MAKQASIAMPGDTIRGSTDVPMNTQGYRDIADLADKLAGRGITDIYTSTLGRTWETARIIGGACGIRPVGENSLQPWHLGEMEGQPTADVLDEMNEYMTQKPNIAVPGMSEESTAPGESFNSFKTRVLDFYSKVIDELKPEDRPLLVTHFRNIKILQAWLKAGMKPDYEVNESEMLRKDGIPGDAHWLHLVGDKWEIDDADLKGSKQLEPGIYLVRHGMTAWNGEACNKNGEAEAEYGIKTPDDYKAYHKALSRV